MKYEKNYNFTPYLISNLGKKIFGSGTIVQTKQRLNLYDMVKRYRNQLDNSSDDVALLELLLGHLKEVKEMSYGYGGGFALIVVLFILLIIVGAAWVY